MPIELRRVHAAQTRFAAKRQDGFEKGLDAIGGLSTHYLWKML
jgi:hypothetical protein